MNYMYKKELFFNDLNKHCHTSTSLSVTTQYVVLSGVEGEINNA